MIELAIFSSFTLFLLLFSSLWVGLSLFFCAYLIIYFYKPSIPLDVLVGQISWSTITSQELLSLPLFVLMGEILTRTRLGQSLFKGLTPWLGRLPGGLLHINVAGCTLFAAICGSSVATTQIVGRVTLPELEKRNYSSKLAIGSLAGAGTLGFLIPPSLIMIIYGVLAEQSIISLFIAGVLPGIGLALLYMMYIAIVADKSSKSEEKFSFYEKITGLKEIAPVAILILSILGTLYFGIAGPSEVAAIGVFGAIVIAFFQRNINFKIMMEAAKGAVRTSSMIGLILIGAALISVAMSYTGVPKYIAELISSFGLSPWALMIVLLVFYIFLGCFLDGTSIIVLTLPIALPLIVQAGYDPIWFGVFLVVVVEMSQITPPIGFNLFIIQAISGHDLSFVAKSAFPFFMLLLLWAITLIIFPGIVTWLPSTL